MAAFCRQQFTFVFRKMLQQPDGTYEASYEVTCPYTYQTNSASFAPRTMPTTGAGGFTGTIKGDDGKTYNNYASYTTLGSGGGNPIIYNQSTPGLTTFAGTPTGYIRDISNPTVYSSAVGGTEITQLRPTITWFDDYSAYVDIFFNLQSCEVKLYTIAGEKIDGHWHFEKTSTRKLYSSASVLKGASYSLPTAEVMQEHIGEDYTLLVSSTPGKFWFEGAPDNPANDTMEQAYLTQLVNNPVVVTKSVNLYCTYFLSDDAKLVKFGTLKKMFGVYKQKSDAALDARFADLPSGGGGGLDTAAVDAAIDAKLETYTTERNEYVAQEIGDATSGLATTESVTDAVGSAKTELRGEMPKAYDFVSNAEREDAGYLTAKNIYEDDIVTGMAASDMINLALRRPSATSTNTWGFLGVKKSDVDAEIAEKSPKPFDSTTNDQEGYIKGSQVYERADMTFKAGDIVDTCLWRTSGKEYLVVKRSDIEAVANAAIEAKMAEVREAVNGVVLYENTSHDHSKLTLSLNGNLFDTYERIEVTARAHRDIAPNAQIVTTISTFTAAEFAMGTGTGARPITHMVGYVWDASNFDEFLLGFIQVYTFLGDNPQTDVYVDDNVRNFRVAADGTNATAAIKPAGTYWVHLERVVGYKKLPEVS